MYELLGRRLDFMEKERDDHAKMVDNKLNSMHSCMECRLIHMEMEILLLNTKQRESTWSSEDKEKQGSLEPIFSLHDVVVARAKGDDGVTRGKKVTLENKLDLGPSREY